MLTNAKDPYIRVAGAVYLCFEDEKEGTRALARFASLPGDPGAWAALNLARRGDKAAALRALDVFRTRSEITYTGQMHRDLQARLLVLLSNSASRSSVPQPGRWSRDMFYPQDGDQTPVFEHYLSWWRSHEAKLTLYDPWLPDLKRQKIE
jgi:hypothetical protein